MGETQNLNLPMRVSVSLRAGVVLALANVICVIIFSFAWMHVKAEPKSISVTGSAKRAIQSDLVVWSGKVSAVAPELPAAYEQLHSGVEKVRAWLKQKGVAENQISLSAIGTWKRRGKDEKGNETEKVTGYEIWQNIEIVGSDVARVSDVSRGVTELIKDGVMLESSPPKYIYTKLPDLKISMLADATKDATTRAQQIAGNSGARLGAITDARMGVMQINPIHSNDASGTGNNDETSYEKEITAVVAARFTLQ